MDKPDLLKAIKQLHNELRRFDKSEQLSTVHTAINELIQEIKRLNAKEDKNGNR